jgi:hypothetical protein
MSEWQAKRKKLLNTDPWIGQTVEKVSAVFIFLQII